MDTYFLIRLNNSLFQNIFLKGLHGCLLSFEDFIYLHLDEELLYHILKFQTEIGCFLYKIYIKI